MLPNKYIEFKKHCPICGTIITRDFKSEIIKFKCTFCGYTEFE